MRYTTMKLTALPAVIRTEQEVADHGSFSSSPLGVGSDCSGDVWHARLVGHAYSQSDRESYVCPVYPPDGKSWHGKRVFLKCRQYVQHSLSLSCAGNPAVGSIRLASFAAFSSSRHY